MKLSKWLIVSNRGTTRLVSSKPKVDWNEVAIKLNVEIPDIVFQRPMIEANVKIKGEFNNVSNIDVEGNLKEMVEHNENLHLVSINIIKEDTE